ncbi:DUF664 domain-containing protein [Streptomyces sp. DSM 44915]|uniref:DUF664 domain-containing protein n=1 Tax=Streptomyces chisholmiae TaxID=3075540 RepID=A0ABU2JTE9_9ACTN|nr:DUF664 domain-containing protein [Streptomyces sp. DSM 44915]MDT0268014.1 DUF664 domain-containing protein [Streptomyces sp. DSM 44915]
MHASTELLVDAFDRIREEVEATVTGLTPEEIGARVGPEANPIGWLVWHLTRVQDDHLAELADRAQVWTRDRWVDRFGLPFPPEATGFGHSSAEVAALGAPDPELLIGYHQAVHERTVGYLGKIRVGDLAEVVDDRWNPPVTLGVRLISVVAEDLQHVGQAAYVRGLLRNGQG